MSVSVVQQKIRDFRIEIRRKSIQKQFNKVRHSYWLYSQQQYAQMQSQTLYLIGCCKLSEPKLYQRKHQLQKLISSVGNNVHNNWNAYIIITKQFIQLSVLTYICQNQIQIEYIFKLCELLLLNKSYQLSIDNEDWKEQIQCNRNKLIEDCCSTLYIRLLQELYDCLRKYSFGVWHLNQEQCAEQLIVSKISKTVSIMSQIISMKDKALLDSKTVIQSTLQLFQQQQIQCKQMLQALFEFMKKQYRTIILNNDTADYLNVIAFSLSVMAKYKCKQAQINEDNDSRQDNEMYIISKQILQVLNMVLDDGENPFAIINYSRWPSNIEIMIKLLMNCVLYDDNWLKYIKYVLHYSIAGHKNTQGYVQCQHNILIQEELFRLSISLISKLCFQQNWICYSHLEQFIYFILQQPTNIFTTNPNNSFPKHSATRKLREDKQNILINVLTNLLINQFQHHCQYQYYQLIQTVVSHLKQRQLMKKWVNWNFKDNFQYLFKILCSSKKHESRQYLIQIGKQLLKNKYIIQDVKNKFMLLKHLFNADKKQLYKVSKQYNNRMNTDTLVNQNQQKIIQCQVYDYNSQSESDEHILNYRD